VNTTSHSLLESVRAGPDGLAWRRWHGIYEPLIHTWLRRHGLIDNDRDDVSQDVLTVVVRRLPEFRHNGRVGAFRLWLKTIAINCLREHWKKRQNDPRLAAASGVLDEWADPKSELSSAWDREHDRHLLRKLMDLLEPEFEPATWAAFRGVVIEGRAAEDVAADLGVTRNVVYVAKSRVLTRLRHEAAGLVDEPEESVM
jgi:RNA polymerase sigma-70 factor (ECF subfamily)